MSEPVKDEPIGPLRIAVEIQREPGCEDLPLPSRLTPGASGMDLPAAVQDPVTIPPGQRRLIPAGFRLAIPSGYEGQVRPRSGLALRHGITVANAPGTIDSDYRGEVGIILMNLGHEPFTVRRGDRVAQLVFCPVARVEWKLVERPAASERGEGGFGHTGL